MGESTSKKTLGRFSDKRYVVPFGRYVGSTEVEPPADEVLVGREGQRAYLIDLLISTGRRGAYLVTGRRGTGKTSFVKHCVAEYEESVFSRFLRGNVGRGFWDRSLVLVFWIALLFGALIISELLQLMVPLTGSKDILPWLIFAPIGILLLYPCVYAKVVFETLIRLIKAAWTPQQSRDSETSSSGILAAFAVVAFAAATWFIRGLGEPPTISQALPILGGCYFFTQAASSAPAKRVVGRGRQLAFHGGLVIYLALVVKLARDSIGSELSIGAAVRDHMGFGLVLLGLGYFIRGYHQLGRASTVKTHTGDRPLGEAIDEAMRKGAGWYIGAGIASLILGLLTWDWRAALDRPATILVLLFLSTALLFAFSMAHPVFHRQKQPETGKEPDRFRPRPGWLLFIKAWISIVIAVQLAYPILASVPLRRIHPQLAELPGEICPERAGGLALCESARFDPEDKGLPQPIFTRRGQEGFWLLSLLIIITVVYLLEYEWIIRPYLRSREDRAFDPGGPAPWDDWEDESRLEERPEAQRRTYRSLAELTLPWMVYRSWLPVLPVSVNLGFDRLDHRQVIQAMLVGLRERYYRTFLAWNSGFANLGRFLGMLVLLMLVTLLGGRHLESLQEKFGRKTWFWVLNADLAPKLDGTGELLVFDIFPHFTSTQGYVHLSFPSAPLRFDVAYSEIHFRVYHVLLFILLLILARWALFRVPLLPYKENLRRIEDLLDSLSARTRTTSGFSLWEPARWVYSIFVDEHVRETERDPVDPRTVELAFLQILEDVQKGGFRFPGAAKLHLTMPAPEITFVFDELDKLGTRVDPGLMPSQEQETEVLHQERERSIKLRSLLSDLKNILASAPARFIFVGGRDLHDEWLADQTSRQPLLTSIFQTEVYLPSLLTDHGKSPRQSDQRLHRRAEEYLLYQHRRASLLHHRSARKRWRPSFGLPVESLVYERFVPAAPSGAQVSISDQIACEIEVIDAATGRSMGAAGQDLLKEFVLFLTHRSMGNPKKLKDLLAGFIRPAGREIESSAKRWSHAPCRHVLRFTDTEIFGIQLIENIYRHIALAFEDRMVQRDDKFAISIFFLTDFLFKFHRRAFSWSNLERVDDLAHIHRLPDLRYLQEEIVNHFSERFLHRMLNGMYSFRFRSDIANEIEYLSRQSAAEMAALNFTLDESQSLKAEYQAALKGREEKNPDLVAAIGELYEFDQDFERARYYYRSAIDLLDKDLKELTAEIDPKTGDFHPGAPIRSILAANPLGLDHARRFLGWGAARLRFMLQIGMTFEHARDFERAEAEYRNARTLARALVKAYAGLGGQLPEEGKRSSRAGQSSNRLHSLKHMNIVFQPLFAEAWLSEKLVGAIDTSTSLVERGLWHLRESLPFVRTLATEHTTDVTETRHANFALTLSQLHNKAGDIFFFKGRQPVSPTEIRETLKTILEAEEKPEEARPDRSTDGYLLRAHYHYAVGLHELRRYIWQRVKSSPVRLSISSNKAPTLRPEALPDLLFRAAAGGVNDMAEATLARVDLFDLFRRLGKVTIADVRKLRSRDLESLCETWLGAADANTDQETLKNWFGIWTVTEPLNSEISLVNFEGPDPAEARLAMSLKLCLVGAGYFGKGGYPEDAGRELLQVCETVTRYLWWGHAVEAIGKVTSLPQAACEPWRRRLSDAVLSWTNMESDQSPPALLMADIFEKPAARHFWRFLIDMAILALRKADTLFRESRYEKGAERRSPLVGETVPAEALTLLCSLGLAARGVLDDRNKSDRKRKQRIAHLLGSWTRERSFREALVNALERHRYPIINRLNGMKVLIDAVVLGKTKGPGDALQQALEWTEELLDLNAQYAAPLHFTPLHSGTTCALLWLRWIAERPVRNLGAVERIYRAAQRDLHNSEEMYTMRRAYYEAISDLYYLYDDFNDRQIHFNHAIQMAGAELTAILKSLIDYREEVELSFPRSEEGSMDMPQAAA